MVPPRTDVDTSYALRLPKIELHAHLTGSISRVCLQEIWEMKRPHGPDSDLEAPRVVMPEGKFDCDIKTFFPLFSSYIYNLCNDLPSIEYSTKSVLHDFQQDNVLHLELRTTPRAIPAHNITKADYIRTILSVLHAHNTNPASRMRVFLILSVDRRNSPAEADEVVDLALEHRSAGVVGVDLCGNPARGDVRAFTPAFARAKAAGLKLTLHFAEIEASSTDGELDTLLSWGPDRLGHVIHVKEAFKTRIEEANVGVELCLSCNVQAKLVTAGYAAHHFGEWVRRDVPVTLCTDDVGVFGSPLSREYYLAAVHFGIDRVGLRALAERPIESIFGGEEEKARLRAVFSQWVG